MVYSVNKYGAAGDGVTNDAAAIQAAIDAAMQQAAGVSCWRAVIPTIPVHLS